MELVLGVQWCVQSYVRTQHSPVGGLMMNIFGGQRTHAVEGLKMGVCTETQ